MRKIFIIMLFCFILLTLATAMVPNFMEAQIRQRLARAYTNLATLSAALESYRVDYNSYPGDGTQYCWNYPNYPYNRYWQVPDTMTTPIAYITIDSLKDPFREDVTGLPLDLLRLRYTYVDMTWGLAGTRSTPSPYYPFMKSWFGSWFINSSGPDGSYGPYYPTSSYPGNQYPNLLIPYDVTNGLDSTGDIIFSQKKSADQP